MIHRTLRLNAPFVLEGMPCDVVPCHETKQQISHKIKPKDREISSVRFPDFVWASNDLVCSQQQYKSFIINVVMIIGNIPKHTVAPYTVAGYFCGLSKVFEYLYNVSLISTVFYYILPKSLCVFSSHLLLFWWKQMLWTLGTIPVTEGFYCEISTRSVDPN